MEEIRDVAGDGHCGFRSVALSLGRSADDWLDIREALYAELLTHQSFYAELEELGGLMCTYNELLQRVLCKDVPCREKFWMSMPTFGDCISNCFSRPVFFFSATGWSYTFLPSLEAPQFDNEPICLAFVDYPRHFVSLKMKPGVFPVPYPCSWWHKIRDSCSRGWASYYHKHMNLGKEVGLPSLGKK